MRVPFACVALIVDLAGTVSLRAQSPTPSARVATAVVPLPASLRAGAGVVALDDDGQPQWLRPSTNGMVCIADAPGDAVLSVQCYHASFIPVVYRMNQLVAAGVPEAVLDRTIEAEIQDGTLKLPDGPTTSYLMFGPMAAYDPSTNTVGNALILGHRIQVPHGTPAATGLPTSDDGVHPYLMASGTYYAHVMVQSPSRAPLTSTPCSKQMGLPGRPAGPADSALSAVGLRPPREERGTDVRSP